MNYPAEGFVIGLSGGIDTAVAASLAVKTGLPTKALILPSDNNQHQDMQDDLELIEMLNIEHYNISIQPAYDSFIAST
ncbi:NAD(+) synthetase, partial [Francisella tularensis subsp. holarctica]|nr:NAD(+) synthetase [Francisella tularensis subsp. holarctica]